MTLEQTICFKNALEYLLDAREFKEVETESWLEECIKILDDMIDRGIIDDSGN